jgi:hypothetical protein
VLRHRIARRIGFWRHHFWLVRRMGPKDCFLTPDEVVQLDALGPYCSSPRGSYIRFARWEW